MIEGRRGMVAALALALALAIQLCHGFKENEFKKCQDLGFCRRSRGKQVARFSIVPQTAGVIASNSAIFSASLLNEQAAVSLELKLTAYVDGFVRLTVDEANEVGRFKIQDLIQPQVNSRTAAWTAAPWSDGNGITLDVALVSVSVTYQPFRLLVNVQGKPAVSINSRDMFNFEHRRAKPEGGDASCDGCWEETFLAHTDSKPKGPEGISLDIAFPGSEHVYGIPERATDMALKPTTGGEPYRLYNLDVFEYLDSSPFGLYGAIPFMLAHKMGLTTGVFWLNAAEMFVDVERFGDGTATQWLAESGVVDLFVFAGPTPADVVKQYGRLTGTTALPQMFSLGYHQCRWNYRDEADAKAVDAGFDIHEIPYDVLWLDIEHTNGKRYLTWDQHLFPNPVDMQDDIASRGRKMVTIVDPHVKRDSSYYIFSEAEKAGHYVKNKGGGDFDGWCWPGQSSYLDVTSPAVREWWAQQFTVDKYVGSTKHLYIWNDMNEPSVFNGPEITMHKDNIHHGSVEHRDVHNLYGLYYHMATADGLKVRGQQMDPDGDRPFVLSRAFFTGTQRVGPIWTGDNAADWKHLKVSIPMLLTLGITGLPYSGADVGGFFGNPTPELLTRWYQAGIFYPFFRGHAHLETQRREPWLFGDEATNRIREAIRARYALLPYMYTLFRHANTTGMPVLRPLWFEFPEQKDTFAIDEEFMLGPAMLVKPVVEPGVTTVDTFLPRSSRWYETATGLEREKSTWLPGLDQIHRLQVTMDAIPSFYRGGHIIPRRERPRRSTATMANDPLTLVIALDHNGTATGDVYLDDGHSFAFKRGQYVHRLFTFAALKLSSTKHAAEVDSADGQLQYGVMQSSVIIERIVFLGLPKGPRFTVKLPGGSEAKVEAGPISVHSGAAAGANAHVLARPNLLVAGDWSIQLVSHKK